MVEVTFFDEADFLDEDEAFVAMMNQGTFKFNQTAFKWMKLKDFKCMKIGHDSPGNPELATKLFFVPNNEEPKKGINFKFCNYAGSGNSTISCKRIIYQNSYMLIHQLSSSTWGKMCELEEEMENLKLLMQKIKQIYKTKTKVKKEQLDEILKHDLWWDAKKCLNFGLVDKIYENKKVYNFKIENLDI